MKSITLALHQDFLVLACRLYPLLNQLSADTSILYKLAAHKTIPATEIVLIQT